MHTLEYYSRVGVEYVCSITLVVYYELQYTPLYVRSSLFAY